jgi:hypothetical protein
MAPAPFICNPVPVTIHDSLGCTDDQGPYAFGMKLRTLPYVVVLRNILKFRSTAATLVPLGAVSPLLSLFGALLRLSSNRSSRVPVLLHSPPTLSGQASVWKG